MNIIDNIEKHHYVATEAQVEQLAKEQYIHSSEVARANSTYLRVLIAGCQAELGGKRGKAPSAESQLAVLEKVHGRYYAAVLRGVTTEDVEPSDALERTERGRRQLERNRRSGFARSAATTVRNYIRMGGDLRGLDLATVSKNSLQRFVAEAQQLSPTDKMTARIQRFEKGLLRAITQQARGDPNLAAANLEAIVERLQLALDELLPDKPVAPQPAEDQTAGRRFARTRVGVPIMRLPTGRSQP
jgi:hypothetical protein